MTDTATVKGPNEFWHKFNALIQNSGFYGFQVSKAASDILYFEFFGEKPKPLPSGGYALKPKESIVSAAVQWEGVTFSLPKPARHGQVLHSIAGTILKQEYVPYVCQGFLTSEGRFVNRVQARQIAHIAGQNPKSTGGDRDLYSEDLW